MVGQQKGWVVNLFNEFNQLILLVWDLNQIGYTLQKGIPLFLCNVFNLTAFLKQKQFEEFLSQLSFYDKETDLPNVIRLIKIHSLFTFPHIFMFLPNGVSSCFSLTSTGYH